MIVLVVVVLVVVAVVAVAGAPEADQKCGGKNTVASHICIAKN